MDKNFLLKLELIGALFTFVVATLLHFCYKWSNQAVWSMLIGSVNESVWEHIKIFILPYLAWGLIELAFIRIPLKNLIIAKTFSAYILALLIVVFFYIYTGILGRSIVWVDIFSVFIWTIITHIISYKIITSVKPTSSIFIISVLLLILLIAMYLTFTVNPPKINMFKDPITGIYGIPPKHIDNGAFYLNAIKLLSKDER